MTRILWRSLLVNVVFAALIVFAPSNGLRGAALWLWLPAYLHFVGKR